MTFKHKLAHRLARLKGAVLLGGTLFACNADGPAGNSRITRLVVVPNNVTIDLTQPVQFQVYSRTQANDSVAAPGGTVSWKTSDAAVASVSTSGLVRGLATGTVTVTATTEKLSGAANVTVAERPVGPHIGWHVSPNGSSSGTGSAAQPWSLDYAVTGAAGKIVAGDTVWLHGGTYRGKAYVTTVAGVAGLPVVFRQYPGERAIIDVAGTTSTTTRGDAFVVRGGWTVWWGFEMTNSDPNRNTNTRANMIINNASNTKYIHLVVHDGGIGFYNYATQSNVEVIGSIFYNNGWQGPVQGGGHALYLKSNAGPLVARDNIMFNQFGYGIQVYSDFGDGKLVNITLNGNASFNNGSISTQYNSSGNANLLVGGQEPAQQSRVVNNMTFFSPGVGVNNLVMGLDSYANSDAVVLNNYAVGGDYVFTVGMWDQLTATGNQIVGSSRVVRVKDTSLGGYTWTGNSYKADPLAAGWQYNGTDYSFVSWKTNTGLGLTDIVSAVLPTTPAVFVRPSAYELGRANIIVYNWGARASVGVDLTSVLPIGSRYEVRNVQDLFGSAVASGTYGGGTVNIPMGGVTPPTPVGGAAHTPPRTGPDFDVFILTIVN